MSGELINLANLKSLVTTDWFDEYSGGGQSNVTYYVFAPSFIAYAYSKGGFMWTSQECEMKIDYWNGSDWTTVLDWSDEVRYYNGTSQTFKHMVDGGTSQDNPNVHIWRVKVASYGVSGDGNTYIKVAGMEKWSDAQYESCRNGLIHGMKIGIYSTSTAIETLIAENCSLRGTPISIETGTYRYICP